MVLKLTLQHIYIYICCGVVIWAKFGLLRCYYLGQVCFLQNTVCQKHYKNRGFSTFCFEKNCARKFEVLLSGPSWPFLSCSQLGPDNNTYLAQIITPQNGYCFQFFALKMCWNTYFYSVFWTSTKIAQKGGQTKTDNFSHFAKHRLIKKKRFVATPLFTPKNCVF